jgi:hypothetical protein
MPAPFWISKSIALELVAYGQPRRQTLNRSARAPLAAVDIASERNGFLVESLGVEEMDDDQAAWADLTTRALEPNAFFEPGFALSAARHFPVKSRPQFIAVWKREPLSGDRRLMALCPIMPPNPLLGDGLASIWLHKQAALATPLVDKTEAVPALQAFLDWLEAATPAAGVVFPKTPRNGPVLAAIQAAAGASGRGARILDEYERAVLYPDSDPDELWTREATRKALKEMQRRQRRLEERGPVEFRQFRRREEVREATEDFLALEASGWKGDRGALLSHPSLTTFVRSATRLLAREGKCQIFSLTLSGRPIAMGIVIESQGRAFFWKIAYDESLRSQAPGIQLVYQLTKAQLGKTGIDLTDSCAIANHPMIDKFWPDRFAICDVAVQLRRDRDGAFANACRKETMRRRLHAIAKGAASRLLGRKAS